jgi:hypothetical protein
MHPVINRLLVGAAAGVALVSGTAAHAEPIKGAPELTHNELYTAAGSRRSPAS